MKKNHLAKKMILTGLTAAMVLGGSTAAFADGNDHGHGRGNGKGPFHTMPAKADINVNINLNFNDIKGKDVEWAWKYIASLASRHVFDGYEDGSFQPRKPITRIEAIKAAVMTLGLGDEAQTEMNTRLNFKDAGQVPDWAVGYVAVALENGLFSEDEDMVQPNKPADRLWATTLLVKALKLEDEAKAKMNSKLTFKDADQIPAGAVGYVEVAVERGLISGYENNTFRPNQPITRAEMAKILDITGEQTGDNDQDSSELAGTVTSQVYNNQFNLNVNGQTRTLTVDANTFVWRNDHKATVADLKAGDEVRVHTINNVVVYIEVTKAVDQNQVTFTQEGYFNSVSRDANGKIAFISLKIASDDGLKLVAYAVDPGRDLNVTGGDINSLAPDHSIVVKGYTIGDTTRLVTSVQIK
jgi:hypothetical protein